jgi:ankyrin repeat protein
MLTTEGETMRGSILVLLILALAVAPAAGQDSISAATAGNLDALRGLLASDATAVAAVDERGCTPLHFAVDGGHAEAVALLLDSGADIEARNEDGDAPLHWAARTDNVAMIDLLLDRGADIDARNHEQETPVLCATQRLQYAVVERLATRGADLEIPNRYRRTPLIWTAREGGDLQMARLLLRLGADVNALDRFQSSALALATWRGFRTLVGVLLDAGASTNLRPGMDQELLHMAEDKGLDRLYEKLVAEGAEVDVTPSGYVYPLHVAAGGGSALIVKDLLKRGAEVGATDMYGWTPLHHAADRGRADVVRVLTAADPAVDRMTLAGRTPLSLAHRKGDRGVIDALKEANHRQADRVFPRLTGPRLGQGDPPATPEPFALDIVATVWGQHGGSTFSPDGLEAFWTSHLEIPDSGYTSGTILTSGVVAGRWTTPVMASFASADNEDDVPFFTPDGRSLFFISRRPLAPGEERSGEHIWVVDRDGDGWGDPRPLPPCVNDMPQHWQISVASNGNLYFASNRSEPGTRGIYVSRPVGGEYTEPEFLGFSGGSPFIAPDESYLITVDSFGRDNSLRVRRDDGSWGGPVSIREFMQGATGVCPRISPDGSAYFFLNGRLDAAADFWVAADFLDEWKRLASLPSAAALLEQAARTDGARGVADAIVVIEANIAAYYVSERVINSIGYRLLGEDLAEEAIAVFEFNVARYPESANVYDSLGEAFMKAGRNAEAIENYRKSLELNPENANATAMLQRLGVGG